METAWSIIEGFWDVLSQMAPYLLFGFLVAGVLSVFVSPRFVERHLGGRGAGPVIKASLLGVPLPLCSCGVIPVAASLRKHGSSRSAATAFLISTPQTGVDSIMVTLGLLGPVFAIFRPITAFISGLLGGGAVAMLAETDGESGAAVEDCHDPCCAPEGSGKLRRMLSYGFLTLPGDIGKALLIGLAIAAVLSSPAVLEPRSLSRILPPGIGQMLVMMAVGIPVYVCATASVPVAASLITLGVTPGAALVFLMTGPATNAATIATVWKVMGRRTAVVYLAAVALTALASGAMLDLTFDVTGISAEQAAIWMVPWQVRYVCAVLLLVVLGTAVVSSYVGKKSPEAAHATEASQKATLSVTGMTCSHCAGSVERALLECEGVDSVKVDLRGGTASVAGSKLYVQRMRDAVEGLGYGVEKITHLPAG